MKKVFIIVALFIALAALITGCSSTSVIKEFDEKGNLVKQTETKESVVELVVASTQNKTVFAYTDGWMAGIESTVFSSENPVPVLRILAKKDNRGVLTIHKDQQNLDKVADIIKAAKSTESLSASSSGIGSSGNGVSKQVD